MHRAAAEAVKIRERLLRPPGGRDSSELDIVSETVARQLDGSRRAQERETAREAARVQRIAEAKAAAIRQREEWQQADEAWIRGVNAKGVQIRTIIDHCCKKYDVKPLDILGKRRTAEICRVRHIIAFLCCELTKRSLPQIGRCLGNRDHTTILHSRAQVRAQIDADPAFAVAIAETKKALAE